MCDQESLNKNRNKFCQGEITYQDLSKECKLELINRSIYLPIQKYQIQKDFSSDLLDKKPIWKKFIIDWSIFTSNYTQYDTNSLFKNLNKLTERPLNYRQVLMDFDEDWLHRQTLYKQLLSQKELFTIRSYTLPNAYKIVNFISQYSLHLIKINQQTQEFIEWSKLFQETFLKDKQSTFFKSNFFPFFFQMIDLIKESKDKLLDFNLQLFEPFYTYQTFSELYDYFILNYNQILTFSKTFWFTVCSKFVKDLDKIIKRAPKTERPLILWRGISQDYISNSHSQTNNNFIHHNFMSTSIDLNATEPFMNEKSPKCCLMRVFVPEDISCLFIGDISEQTSESEIIFGTNCVITIQQPSFEVNMVDNSAVTKPESILCNNIEKVKTSFVSIIGYQK
jgi:hypothetical protein